MNDLIERLKACKLPESMRFEARPFVDTYSMERGTMALVFYGDQGEAQVVCFANDDCPGSALFIVRGLKALKSFDGACKYRPAMAMAFDGEFYIINLAGDPENAHCYATMAQAVAEALIAVFGVKE